MEESSKIDNTELERLQHSLNLAIPKGYFISIEELESMEPGSEYFGMTSSEILESFFKISDNKKTD